MREVRDVIVNYLLNKCHLNGRLRENIKNLAHKNSAKIENKLNWKNPRNQKCDENGEERQKQEKGNFCLLNQIGSSRID